MKKKFINTVLGGVYGEPFKSELSYRDTYQYLNKYLDKMYEGDSEVRVNPAVKENKTIWICWSTGMESAPMLVQRCYESVVKNKPDGYDVIQITFDNISDYILIPEYIWMKYKKGIISKTHVSDVIRVELLHQYGGCWIDATVYCSGKIPTYMLSGDMFVFKWSVFDKSVLKMSSWWIYSAKGNELVEYVRNLLYAYWKNEENVRNYYLLHIAFSKVIDSSSVCQSIFRNIKYVNNSNPHALYGKLGYEYNIDTWNYLKDISKVHKLSYKQNFLQGDIDNFYMALIENRLT